MIMSLNIGMPATLEFDGQPLHTGVDKQPTGDRCWLGRTHFEGDGQADLVHHGGVDKAVCVYPYEHYAYWEAELKRKLSWAAFGENITVLEAVENDVHVGDQYQLGEAVVEVSQPRGPCYKVAKKHGITELPLHMQQTGYTGYYYRVIQEGFVQKGDVVKRIFCHPDGLSIMYANRVVYQKEDGREGLLRLLACEKLSDAWREMLSKRLE